MAVEFTIEQRDAYLRVTVVGEIRRYTDILSYGKPLWKQAEENGIKRILIDYRKAEMKLDYYGAIQLAKHVEKSKFNYAQFRLVHLVAPDTLALFQDYLIPSQNRGFYYHSCTNEDDALAWLFKE